MFYCTVNRNKSLIQKNYINIKEYDYPNLVIQQNTQNLDFSFINSAF